MDRPLLWAAQQLRLPPNDALRTSRGVLVVREVGIGVARRINSSHPHSLPDAERF